MERRSFNRQLLLVLALASALSSFVYAQPAGLDGLVTDAQHGAIGGASITLSPSGAAPARRVRADADGVFRLADVPDGTYTLTVAADGFQPTTQRLELDGARLRVAIVLQVAGFAEDVRVEGATPSTLDTPTVAASRLALTPLDTPASVSSVSGDLVRELGTPTLIVAKALAPGITSSAPMGSGGNLLNARGFTGTNSVKQLFNGLEIYNAGGVVSFPFDPWAVDHVGVLAGPASVLYGTGAIGGAVNVVSRRPDSAKRQHEVALAAGGFNSYHAALDSTGPISERVSYRFDVSQRTSRHWVERGESNSLAVSASVRFDATETLRVTVSNDFGNQDPSKYLGTPVQNNAPRPELTRLNYNVADARLNFTDNWTTVETVWTPSPRWSLHNATYAMYHDRVYRDVPTYAYVPATNQVRRTQFRDIDDTYETQYGSTGYAKHAGRLFGRRADTLVGIDVNRNFYKRDDNVRGGTSVVDALVFAPGNYLDFYDQESKPFYRIHVNQVALYAEHRLHLTDRASFVVGFRRDRYHVNRYDELVSTTTESNHDATSWNAGAVYDVRAGLVVYGQYAAASDPVNSLASIAANQQGFNLSPGRQVEVGVKQSTWQGRLEWTFAAYRIVKEDLLTPSISNPSLTEQVGQQSSRGVEASALVAAGPLRLVLNGTLLRAHFDDFVVAAGASVVRLDGNVPVNVPERSANVLLFWDIAPRWSARAVLRSVGRRFADNSNAPASRIPGYRVLDIGTRWLATPRLSLDVRVDNLTDAVYADSGSATAWLLGAPRAATVSTNIRF